MALVLLFPEKGILNFAAARRPLLIYTNKREFIEIKGTALDDILIVGVELKDN